MTLLNRGHTKVLLVFLAALSLILAGMIFFSLKFRLNTSLSQPIGLYAVSREKPMRGDLVGFCLSEDNAFARIALERGYLGKGNCPLGLDGLLKNVVGLPGDRVAVTSRGIKLNGRLLPMTKRPAKDSRGRPVPPSLLQSGTIPEGRVLVLSQRTEYSFDSRHFGLVPTDSLTLVKPVFTFDNEVLNGQGR